MKSKCCQAKRPWSLESIQARAASIPSKQPLLGRAMIQLIKLKKMKSKKSLWPVGIVAAFVVFICGTISLVVFACSQKQDLVSSDYYEQEIRFQGQLEKVERAYRSAQPASIAYDSAAKCIRISVAREP